MFELADKMVGIYKTHDVTQTLTVNPKMMLLKINRQIPEVKEEENNQNLNN